MVIFHKLVNCSTNFFLWHKDPLVDKIFTKIKRHLITSNKKNVEIQLYFIMHESTHIIFLPKEMKKHNSLSFSKCPKNKA